MPTYTLSLRIDDAILALQSRDNLCIAKKVNGAFTTVYLSATLFPRQADQRALSSLNELQWVDYEEYRVIGVREHRHGLLVEAITSPREIRFGDETSYNSGSFSTARPAPINDFENPSGPRSREDSFIVKGVSRDVHVGVEVRVGSTWGPIYVDPNDHPGMLGMMVTPENEYLIFWSSHLQGSTMIDETKVPSPKRFSFNGTSKSLRFGYQIPNQPSGPGEQPGFYDE